MNCPICNKELEIKQKKVGETANGEAIFNEFAICHDCRKQWNLDKHRAKQMESSKAKEEVKEVKEVKAKPQFNAEAEAEVKKPVKKRKKRPVAPAEDAATKVIPTEELDILLQEAPRKVKKKRPAPVEPVVQEEAPAPVKKRPVKKAAPMELELNEELQERPRKVKKKRPAPVEPVADEMVAPERPRRKKRPRPVEVEKEQDDFLADIDFEEKKPYSNIPPKHIRESREKEMRENYQNMLDEDDEEDGGGSSIIWILIIIIILLAIAAFAGYWFILR